MNKTARNPHHTALLVIDAQESFRHRDFFREDELPAYLRAQQRLIDGAQAAGIPIVQILHVSDQGPFAEASGHVRTLEPLSITSQAIFRKRRHSALVGTGLDVWLNQQQIHRLWISGIRTEQCCETTTRHASDLGFEVDFISEAMLSFPMVDARGRRWEPEEIRAATELVLAGRFARILSVEQALGQVQPGAMAA